MKVQELASPVLTISNVPRTKIKFAAAAVSLLLLITGFAAAELYARRVQKYLLWSPKLEKGFFFELDRLKLYNRHFYESRRAYFRNWPFPLEFFEATITYPRYLYKPNLSVATRGDKLESPLPGEKVFWSSNSWGFRGAEFSPQKPPGVIRVVCLGASTTEGSQSDTETYPYYLQQELSNIAPQQKFEVINAGHHAHEIRDLIEVLRTRIFPLNPDIVLFYEGTNNIAFHEFVRAPGSCQIGDCWLTSHGKSYKWFYQHSAAFVMMTDRLGLNDQMPALKPHWFDVSKTTKSELIYREGLAEIARESGKRKIPVVFTSFITLAHTNLRLTRVSHPSLFEYMKSWYPVTAGELGQIYDRFNRQSLEVAKEFGIPYADVAAKFPKDPKYFPFDLIHLSPAGNRILAKYFADFFKQQDLI